MEYIVKELNGLLQSIIETYNPDDPESSIFELDLIIESCNALKEQLSK